MSEEERANQACKDSIRFMKLEGLVHKFLHSKETKQSFRSNPSYRQAQEHWEEMDEIAGKYPKIEYFENRVDKYRGYFEEFDGEEDDKR